LNTADASVLSRSDDLNCRKFYFSSILIIDFWGSNFPQEISHSWRRYFSIWYQDNCPQQWALGLSGAKSHRKVKSPARWLGQGFERQEMDGTWPSRNLAPFGFGKYSYQPPFCKIWKSCKYLVLDENWIEKSYFKPQVPKYDIHIIPIWPQKDQKGLFFTILSILHN